MRRAWVQTWGRCAVVLALLAGTAVAVAVPASAATPGVTSVSPSSGTALGGTRVTIFGHDFDQVKQVRFNSAPGTVLHVVSSTTLLVSAPAHPVGTVGIWLDLNSGAAVNSGAHYTYTTPPPGPPTDVTGSGGTGTASVSWTNPTGDANLAGTRVCRGTGDTAPTPATCSPGWTLGKGVHTFADKGVPAGGWHYWLFAFDTFGGYGVPAVGGVTVRGAPVPGPVVATTASNVTADVLPTTQIDGVAWTQAVVFNTVYVGGRFGHARPAGTSVGDPAEVVRNNLLAYDLTTGNLISSWAPSTNGQVLSMVTNPSRTILYIGGNFTTVNGEFHPYLAAFDLKSGQLISSFAPQLNSTVRAVTASDSTVYVGGDFTFVGTARRTHLAAFDPTGALTSWTATTNEAVRSMLLTPDGQRVVIGGGFATINGVQVNGIGAVSVAGARVPWHTGEIVYSYGHSTEPTSGGAVLSLSTDGTNVYGTLYNFGSAPGGFEGMWAASPLDGTVRWIEDCHGDTYGAFPYLGTVYIVGHPHWCGNDNGWENPNRTEFLTRRAMAFTTTATGALSTVTERLHAPRAGLPSPSIVDWFPRLTPGTASGQSQAAWAISGHGDYVALAGEFPQVNGIPQQGLVRFATRPESPAKNGPQGGLSPFAPSASRSGSSVVVSAPTVWDADSLVLTYTLLRDGAPVTSTTAASTFWSQPRVSLTDPSPPSGTHAYAVRATDSDGNPLRSPPVSVKVS